MFLVYICLGVIATILIIYFFHIRLMLYRTSSGKEKEVILKKSLHCGLFFMAFGSLSLLMGLALM